MKEKVRDVLLKSAQEKSVSLPFLASKLGLHSVRWERICDPPLEKLPEQELGPVPKKLEAIVKKMVSMRAHFALNIYAEENEILPLLKPENTILPEISPDMVIHLCQALYFPSFEKECDILGAAAMMPLKEKESAEVLVHIKTFKDQFANYSLCAQGRDDNDMDLFQRVDPHAKDTVLTQVACFEQAEVTDFPYVFEWNAQDITPKKITDFVVSLGIKDPFAMQLVVFDGETRLRVLKKIPRKNCSKEDIAEDCVYAKVHGPLYAAGIKSNTPYTQEGHLHGVSLDGKKAGHVMVIHGRVRIAISFLQSIAYATFDSRKKGKG